MIVYQFENKINGKKYIGITSQRLCNRTAQHTCRARKEGGQRNRFYAALNKYGLKNFDIKVLSECKTRKELVKKEIELIKKIKPEYNTTPGGSVGALGYRFSDEQRKQMSESRKGRKAWNKGIPNTPEQKRKISESLKINNPMFKLEHRITLSKKQMGKNNAMYKHGNRIGQSKYHNSDGSLKAGIVK